MPKLDPNSREFREAGHRIVDWVADYLDNVDRHDVLARVAPGDGERSLPTSPRDDGPPYAALLADFESKILPGITHWNHPAFFAYFSITGSQAGILAELLTAALNANGMLWKTSPSLTELETVTLRWLREALGLPDGLFGIINDTASINSFLALAAAREALGFNIRGEGMTGRDLPERERRRRPRLRKERRRADRERRRAAHAPRRARGRDRARPRRRRRAVLRRGHDRHDVDRLGRSGARGRADRTTRNEVAPRRQRLR